MLASPDMLVEAGTPLKTHSIAQEKNVGALKLAKPFLRDVSENRFKASRTFGFFAERRLMTR